MESYFNHDEMIIGSVEELEPNFFRASVTVPSNQVQLFLKQIQQAKESDSPPEEQDIRDAAKMLVYVAWEEVAHRQDRMNVGPPAFDPERSEGVVQKGKDFKIVISGPLYPKPDLDLICDLNLSADLLEFQNSMIEQELSDQRLDLGKILSADGPAQRGSILTGRLSITMPAKGAEDESSVLAQDGRLRLPLVGEDCAFGSLVLTNSVSKLLGATSGEVVWDGPAPRGIHSVLDQSVVRYSLAVQKVEHCEPCSIDAVVSHYEMSGESELRSIIESGIRARIESKNTQSREGALLQALLPFAPEIPPSILEQVEKESLEKFVGDLQSKGMNESEVNECLNSPQRDLALQSAFVHLKQTTVIHLLREELEISIAEEDLLQSIREQAAQEGIRPEELRSRIMKDGQLDAFQASLTVRKVLRSLLAKIDES